MIGRLIDRALGRFDNERREWVVRRRVWMMRNFPYRTCEMTFPHDQNDLEDWDGRIEFGNYKWHRPDRWRKR